MSPAAAETAGSFSGIPVAFMEFCLAPAKLVLPVARTAPLLKAKWELSRKAMRRAPFPEVTVGQRRVAENPPPLWKLNLDSLVLPVLRLDRRAPVSFARARPR